MLLPLVQRDVPKVKLTRLTPLFSVSAIEFALCSPFPPRVEPPTPISASAMIGDPRLQFDTLCEVISAVHLSHYITSPFEDRGGLFLVAPPGALKTTAAEILSEFTGSLVISDLTVKSLTAMRDDLLGGNIHTLIFSDYSKIHKRHASIASNIEGIVMGLAGEGFRKPAFGDQRVQSLPARAAIIGCMTTHFCEEMEANWLDTGFYRRFLFSRYRLKNPEVLEDSIAQWRKADLDGNFLARIPNNRSIPYSLTEHEVNKVRHSLRMIGDRKIPLIMAQKILCVLKWKFQRKDEAIPMQIWMDFASSLSKDGAILEIKTK